jgi:hypothetical protein
MMEMETSLEPSLRPLRLGEVLDASIRLYRRHFWLFVGVIVVAEIPFLLVQVVLPLLYRSNVNSSEDVFSLHWWVINGSNWFMRWVFVDSIGTVALSYVVSQAYMRQPTNLFATYWRTIRSLLWLAGVMFVLPGMLLLITIWGLVPCIGWISSSGIFIFLTVAVMPLIPVVLVVEGQSSLKAILRAWDLARRRFFWLIFFNGMLAIFGWTLSTGPSLAAIGAVAALVSQGTPTANLDTVYGVIVNVSGTVFNMLFLPIQIGAWTVTYYDIRVRSEAFDLALLTVDNPEDTNQFVQLPPLEKWFSLQDLLRLSSISIAIIAVFILIQMLYYGLIVLLLLAYRGL